MIDLLLFTASLATTLGIPVAAWQLRESRKLAQVEFEDSLDQQYRELARDIPYKVFLGDQLPEDDCEVTLIKELIYNYLDLSNEQAYYHKQGRISADTWISWQQGILTNINKPGIAVVWEEVKTRAPGSFSNLEALEQESLKAGKDLK